MCATAPVTITGHTPSAYQRGYDREHQARRKELIKKVYWCSDPYNRHPNCLVRGTIRDHVVPLSRGGAKGKGNEQLLCASCNTYKQYRDGSRDRGIKMFECGG